MKIGITPSSNTFQESSKQLLRVLKSAEDSFLPGSLHRLKAYSFEMFEQKSKAPLKQRVFEKFENIEETFGPVCFRKNKSGVSTFGPVCIR